MSKEASARFLEEAGVLAGVSAEEVLRRILHEGSAVIEDFAQIMRIENRDLFTKLDYGLRLRNPGLHYVPRKNYLGYRREEDQVRGAGERSQVFVSVLRNATKLQVVLPLDPSTLSHLPSVRDLSGIGHHGVGNSRVAIDDEMQLERFFDEFDFWLRKP